MISLERLDTLKGKLDALRPLPAGVFARLHEDLVLQWTYNSNAIEGNTLTLKETKVALEGVTIGGKTLREHFEALNHRDAIAYVEAMVANREPFSAHAIRSLHALILKNIDEDNAGVWRKYNVTIAGARNVPPDSVFVPEQMTAFIQWHESEGQQIHPVELLENPKMPYIPDMPGISKVVYLSWQHTTVKPDLANHLYVYHQEGLHVSTVGASNHGALTEPTPIVPQKHSFSTCGFFRSSAGGFGGTVPQPSSGGSGG